MFTPDQYQLIDFGDGRRLERFGPWWLDRPCPAAEQIAAGRPGGVAAADARFERDDGDRRGVGVAGEPPRAVDGRPWADRAGTEADRVRPPGGVCRAGGQLGLDRRAGRVPPGGRWRC